MLFPGWEVRIVKNCDRGLENGTLFQAKVTVFHSIQTNPKVARLQGCQVLIMRFGTYCTLMFGG